MKSPILIGLGHKARNGKDTVASHIKNTFGEKYNIELTSFGKLLKDEVNEVDQLAFCMEMGIPYNFEIDMSDPLCQTKHGKQAPLQQWWGTEYRRKQNPFYWVNKAEEIYQNSTADFLIFSDVRFKNEHLWITSKRGYKVKVVREGFVDKTRDPNHLSEIDLDYASWDYEIHRGEGELAGLKEDSLEVFDLICRRVNPVDEMIRVNQLDSLVAHAH